jgi:hypothetical protein
VSCLALTLKTYETVKNQVRRGGPSGKIGAENATIRDSATSGRRFGSWIRAEKFFFQKSLLALFGLLRILNKFTMQINIKSVGHTLGFGLDDNFLNKNATPRGCEGRRLGQRHGLQIATLTSYFYKNNY